MRARSLALWAPLLVTGCTGLSLGENNPGGDTFLEYGDIAVDDRTEKAFVLNNFVDEKTAEETSLLRSIDPDSAAVSEVIDLSGRGDARILFPASGILVMSELNQKDELVLFDKDTFKEKAREEVDVRYHGTRMSPSRNWIAVADNTSEKAPIHIIDGEILTQRVIPHNGEWLEAMWKNQADELFSIVFYNMDQSQPDAEAPYARILSWSMDQVAAGQFKPDDTGFWPDRKLDIQVPNVTGDFLFSFTWVGISPDDKWAVFPVREADPNTPEEYALIVVETATGDVRIVPNAKGPVGFTPDSSTIVSYDDSGSQNGANGETPNGEIDQRLLLIDVETLEVDAQDVDISGGISYFISRDGNFVVVASNYGDEKIVLYDLDNNKSTQMAGPALGLDEFVSRKGQNELWLADKGSLYKLDMNQGELSLIDLAYSIQHLNILPKHDWMVMSDVPATGDAQPAIHFFDPVSLKDVKAVEMPAVPAD
ncbi:MAG: hypothetical protein IPK82_00820 [Polyangiaceae bacterium]|nr:hypothetical protein [Polyangiaceae bacterium]